MSQQCQHEREINNDDDDDNNNNQITRPRNMAQAQYAGCSLSVCRPVGLRYRPILVGAFCRRSTGFVGSALSDPDRAKLDSASAHAQRGRPGRRSLQQRRLPVSPVAECAVRRSEHAYVCHSVGAVRFLQVAVAVVFTV